MELRLTVAEAQAKINSRQFTEYMAYDLVEPFGEPWRQTGVLCAIVAGLFAKQQPKPENFMPLLPEGPRQTDWRHMKMIAKSFAMAHNAKRGK